jgi:hypothetical protein
MSVKNLTIVRRPLLADKLNDDTPAPRPVVEIGKHHLLPGAQRELFVDERDAVGGLDQKGSHMGKAIAIVPGLIVVVGTFRRQQFLQEFRDVLE